MTGSLRQRGPDSWQLRIYLGVDADSGRERWASKTVHGSRRYATARLAEFVEEAGYARLRADTVADLLDRWLAHASPAWSTTTLRQTRSVIEHHLKRLLGHVAVNKPTTIDIDDVYRHLLCSGGPEGRPLFARHGSSGARRVAPGADAGGALGVGVVEPGQCGAATADDPGRGAPAVAGSGDSAARPRRSG